MEKSILSLYTRIILLYKIMDNSIIKKSFNKAIGGGITGASAMGCQVLSLMWLRTTMNYQYRYGTKTLETIKKLYKEGGVRRFYRGFSPAIIQGPLSRFGDTATNTGIITLLDSYDSTKDLPTSLKTLVASATAALWRINLMPIDNCKTILQVEGKNGLKNLGTKFRTGGFPTLYYGSFAASSATFVGHYPWFFTFNYLNSILPTYGNTFNNLVRNAGIGFTSSVISDVCSNSLRVIKTYKQSTTEIVTYPQAVKNIVASQGVLGLMGRGLKTRIISNGCQGMMFSVLWKYFQQIYEK